MNPGEPAFAELCFARPAGVVEPRLVEIVAASRRVRAPHQIGEAGEEREIEVARALGLIAQLDAMRCVARDYRIALQLAVVVADGGDHVVAAEARPVLAQVPALAFGPAVARCHRELPLGWRIAVDGIKDRERPADDLVDAVAGELLGARIP